MKDYRKRQILYGVCCLLFLSGIVLGIFTTSARGDRLTLTKFNEPFWKMVLASFKYSFSCVLLGVLGGKYFLLFVPFLKGFSLSYITFGLDLTGIKRLVFTALFLIPEMVLTAFLFFVTVYFLSIAPICPSQRGYKTEIKRRSAEIVILFCSSLIIALLCGLMKYALSPIIVGIAP